ncbi:MAG: Ca-activated chloride channel [Chthoniobacter sp.]|jgi:Ca-activated chloride channel family protein|nr:Ca-activated chloride channel [Chthoniobacter sp.]
MSLFKDYGLSFAEPWLLLLLLAVPLLAWLRGQRGGVPAVVFSSTASIRSLGRVAESRAGNFLTSLMFLALALLTIALARPQLGRSISHVEASGIDIMLVLDVSRSMLTEDYTIGGRRANRIDTIKQVTQKFIESRPNDRIGIIAFAGRPYLVSPLTLDHDWLLQNLERVRIGLVEDGTAIGSAIASACNRLRDKESKSKVIILLTDGDNNAGKVPPETAAEAAKALGIKLHAIGAGTNGVAPFPVTDQFGRTFYQDVQVAFNEEGLKKIAEIATGNFYYAGDTRSLQNVFEQIDKMEKSKVELTQYKQYRDLFPWLLGVGFGLLGVEMMLAQTAWRKLP